MNPIHEVANLIVSANSMIAAVERIMTAIQKLRTTFGGDEALPRLAASLEEYKRVGNQIVEDGERWLREHPPAE